MFLIYPQTHTIFITMTETNPFFMGFIKVAVLATMGELLAARITGNRWVKPSGWGARFVVWGFLGIGFVIMFEVYASGVNSLLSKGLLPGKDSKIMFA
ncbi:MAG: hypothetical protein AAGU27_23865, partial [Dehalobacterium sp.]